MIRYQKIEKMHRRPRRNRKSVSTRGLLRETSVRLENLIMPLFLVDGDNVAESISSLPVAKRFSLNKMLEEIDECISLGLTNFILFPKIPSDKKDKTGSFSYDPQNFYLVAAKKIKKAFPQINLISDVALDPYNIDGHDGIVRNARIANDETLVVLSKMALAQAKAGFDMIGPSDMMDGRVGSIREALDQSGYTDTSIMSYTAKYASAFYGPFRDALDSAPISDPNIPKDKTSYQMDPANKKEALLEAELDILEGADFIMVKPALHYLDIISDLATEFDIPIAAYHVSGECAMLWAACQNNWLEYQKAMPETLLCIRRAGASAIITYFAKEYALLVKDGSISG